MCSKKLIITIIINILYINIVISHNLHTRNIEISQDESDKRYIMSKGELIIGMEIDAPPMNYIDDDGELTGFDIEFAKSVCSKLGIDIVFKEIEWSKKELELQTKSIDCVWNALTVTEERREIFEFTRVYLNNRPAVVIRRCDASKFPDIQSLSTAKIAAGIDTTGEETLLNDPYLSQSDYTPLDSQNEAVFALMDGLYDAIIIDYTLAKGYIPNDNSELMIIDGIRFQEEQYAVGFRHGSDMPKKINDIFLDMILDGSLSVLSGKYNLEELQAPLKITDADYIMSKKKMIIGFQKNVPPMSFSDKNGELIGFDIEFAKAVCQQLGIEAEFKNIYWDKKEIELKSRNIDCIWNALTVTEKRRENIKFSHVYMSNKQVVVIKKTNASKYTDLRSLSGAKFTAEIKSKGEEIIQNNSYFSELEYVSSSSVNEAIEALVNDDVDGIIIDYIIANYNIANGNSDFMIVEGINFDEEVYAVGFRKDSDMTIKINEHINNLINDGTLESIANKYNLIDLYNSAVKPDENSDLSYIMSKGEMIIGIEENSSPMTYYDNDGKLTGFNIEFAKALCSELGIDAVFKNIDFDKMETELNTKNVDCLWNSLAVTEERSKIFEFSHVYLNNKQVVVIKKSNASKFSNTKELSKAKISAGLSTTGEEIITTDPYLSKAEYTPSHSQYEAILDLEAGKFDAIVIDYTIAIGNTNNKNSDLMIVEGINLQEEQYAIGFRVGSDIIKKINNVILDMIMNGSLGTLASKYNLSDLFSPLKVTDASYIIGKGKMIMGFTELLPFGYYDDNGKLIGFDIEFAKAVCNKLGIDAEFKIIDWEQKEIELKNRNIDCIWNALTVTEERRENMKFTRIYMSNKQVVIIKKSNASKYVSLKNLIGAKLTYEIGSTGEVVVKSNQYLSKTEHSGSSSQNEAFLALENGNVDAIVIDYTTALNNIDDQSDLIILEEINTNEEMYAIGFRTGSDMTLIINKIINDMITDGSLASIANKYNLIDLYNLSIKIDRKSDMEYIMSKGEMTIGVEINRPPMTYYNNYGELTGFDTEFAQAVCSKLGIDAVFKEIIWSEKEIELNSKNIDCIWNSLTVTMERQKLFKFSYSYLSNRAAVVIRTADASKFLDAKSLEEATMSAGLSTTGEEALLADPSLSKAKYVASLSQDDAILGLINGTFDGIVIDYTLAKGTIADGNSDLMVVKGIRFPEEEYAIGFRINSDVTNKINNMILDMILDDSLTVLAEKYDLVELFTPLKITDTDYIINNGKMIIGFDGSISPMTYYDDNGKLTGFDIEFAEAVCKVLDIKVEFKEILWTQKETELKKRSIDCIWGGLSVTDERRETIKFSRVYMNNKQVVVIKKSNVLKYTDLESLNGKKLASKTGSLGEETIKTYISNVNYKGYSSIEEMFIALKKGNLDAVVIDYTIAKQNINNDGFTNLMIVERIKLIDDQYAIGFRYGSDMTKKINEIIKNMTLDGTINEIAQKYDLLNLYTSEKKSEYIMKVTILLVLYTILIIIL